MEGDMVKRWLRKLGHMIYMKEVQVSSSVPHGPLSNKLQVILGHDMM